MQRRILKFALASFTGLSKVSAAFANNSPSPVVPFTVQLGDEVPRMLDLVNNTRLPEKPEYPGLGDSYGMDLDVLKSFQDDWVNQYSWQEDQTYLNRYPPQIAYVQCFN